ncbi:MAG: NAD(+) synthase [Acidobacteria bacterium]|nr:NAD(+) synthase [Acidobacteriota bacterium]
MAVLRLALASVNQTPLDWQGNDLRLRLAIRQARAEGAQVLCLPELAISGYGCEDFFFHPHVSKRSFEMVKAMADEAPEMVVLVGLPVFIDGKCYNALAVLNQGSIKALVLKSYLAREGIHYEPRWFTAWPSGRKERRQLYDQEMTLGSYLFDVNGFVFGCEICEDAWVADDLRPCRLLRDAHMIFNASASHFSLGKDRIREEIVSGSSKRFPFGYAYANLVGNESGRAIYDGELLFARNGEVVQRSRALGLQEWNTVCYDFEYEPRAVESIRLHVNSPVPAPAQIKTQTKRVPADYDQAFVESASLALWDYLRKSGTNGFVVSLSGGVDSSSVAVLVWAMATRVLKELTLEQRKAAWPRFPLWDQIETAEQLVGHLLVTAYQSTRNSGPVTAQAAEALAKALGARHYDWDVDFLVEGYKGLISRATGLEWDWKKHDITLQNIQARVRGPGVWMLANLENRLLLSTSNRSEVAVGYATMDGDTCGSLSPIAGVQKTYLRRWLVRMQQGAVKGYPAVPALHFVNEQQPTAELRPTTQSQTDEGDLMPYLVLDILEKLMTSDHCDPQTAFNELMEHEVGSAEECLAWTRKFFRLFATSQWKRERYAPAFHLDDQNLDPKTWARFPILNGAFAVECAELKEVFKPQEE